nr:MAG TPA: hypothetical protein [Caudoviricetes sp.]
MTGALTPPITLSPGSIMRTPAVKTDCSVKLVIRLLRSCMCRQK